MTFLRETFSGALAALRRLSDWHYGWLLCVVIGLGGVGVSLVMIDAETSAAIRENCAEAWESPLPAGDLLRLTDPDKGTPIIVHRDRVAHVEPATGGIGRITVAGRVFSFRICEPPEKFVP